MATPEDRDVDAQRTAEEATVEHLRAAAREVLGAARNFLDVVEDLVEDDDRMDNAVHAVTEFLSDAGSAMSRAGERVANAGRVTATDGDDAPNPDAPSRRARVRDVPVE